MATTTITTGRLTKNAATHTREGKSYVLLSLADSDRKRNDKGEFHKDENGHWVCYPPVFHSVFVNGILASAVDGLKKGALIKVYGSASISIEIDKKTKHNRNVLNAINAFKIDTEPFKKDAAEAMDAA